MKNLIKLSLTICLMVYSSRYTYGQGGFGGFHINTEYNSSGNLLLFGGGGAWVINQNFYLGGAGYGLRNSINTDSGELSFGYGGLMLGYFKKLGNSEFRMGADLLIGSGGYSVNSFGEQFYLVEPNLKLWYSISSFIHLSGGIYYRSAFLDSDALINPDDLNNPGFKLTLNFGKL